MIHIYDVLERGREVERGLAAIIDRVKRAAYDRRRDKRPAGRHVEDRSRQGGHFVAVDFEGIDFGKPFFRAGDDPKQNPRYQQHRAIQLSAGGADGYEDVHRQNVNGFKSEEICEILTSLPAAFVDPRKGPDARAPIFVSYAFGYDIGQIVRDMPYEKAWELLHGKPWDRRDDATCEANFNRWVWWRGYALSYMPRKSITIARLKDREKPGRHVKRPGNDWVSTETEIISSSRIEIVDAFSYWGTRFVDALNDMPRIRLSDKEVEKIVAGKNKRGIHHRDRITEGDLAEMLEYTSLELIGLVDMMTSLRQGHRDAIAHAFHGRAILDPKRWWGPGASAEIMLDLMLGIEPCPAGPPDEPKAAKRERKKKWTALMNKKRREVLGDVTTESEPLRWARHAFFGGRIDPPMAGKTEKATYEYDLTSAYPAAMIDLPSMKGTWVFKEHPTREEIERASLPSIFEVHTSGCNRGLPLYPYAWRCEDGAVKFPCGVDGYYFRDEVLGAFAWFDEFTRRGEIADYGFYGHGPKHEIVAGWFFIPADPDFRPFADIARLFEMRAQIMKENEKDARGHNLKVSYNSAYGKLAQSVGRKGHPPKFASPWLAGAITARTRRLALEAALKDPYAVIRFATDAVQCKRQLDLECAAEKVLGAWMKKTFPLGGSYVQAGIWLNRENEGEFKIATRGFSPQNTVGGVDAYRQFIFSELFEAIPRAWAEDNQEHEFDYKQYMSLGVALSSRENWKLCGHWKSYKRHLNIQDQGRKRRAPNAPGKRKARASKLVPLPVVHRDGFEEGVMSHPYKYGWQNEELAKLVAEEEEHAHSVAGF